MHFPIDHGQAILFKTVFLNKISKMSYSERLSIANGLFSYFVIIRYCYKNMKESKTTAQLAWFYFVFYLMLLKKLKLIM